MQNWNLRPRVIILHLVIINAWQPGELYCNNITYIFLSHNYWKYFINNMSVKWRFFIYVDKRKCRDTRKSVMEKQQIFIDFAILIYKIRCSPFFRGKITCKKNFYEVRTSITVLQSNFIKKQIFYKFQKFFTKNVEIQIFLPHHCILVIL